MDPHERLPELLGGAGCTVCGAAVPAERIVVLAAREDLAFVELRCRRCGSAALTLVVLEDDSSTGAGRPVIEATPYGEFGPADEARLADGRPIDADDVLGMHAFLRTYRGDLRGLVDGSEGPASS
jgi:hypothetical protein